MSLTNPNKVVTEEKLAEFYGQLLPYLGGMPEAVVNKFSKSDLYSTTEKIVGCWTDGRPVYQKTFTFTTPSSINTDTNIVTVPDGETVIDYCGIISRSDGGIMYLGSNYPSQSNSLFFVTSSTNLKCKFRVSISTDTSRPAVITLKYTKSTDAANSFKFSTETDYSTTEKIVGTWIDGKPLYQKTVSCGTLANKTAKQVATGVSNIQHVISCKGYGVVSSSNNHINLPYNGTGDNIDIYWNGTSNTIDLVPNFNATVITGCYVTIQYTKTTD